MNKVFKVIWNHATQTWTAVSEISHAHGKKSASDKRKAVAAAVAAAGALMASGAAQAGVETSASTITIKSDNPNNVVGTNQGTRNINIGTGANTYRSEAGNVLSHDSIAIGSEATGTGDKAVAIGNAANATKENSVALGHGTVASDTNAIAIGQSGEGSPKVIASGVNAIAIGMQSQATGESAIAEGPGSRAGGKYGVALGRTSKANAEATTALGNAAEANIANGVALGASSVTTTDKGVLGYNPSNPHERKYAPLTGNVQTATTAAVSIGNGQQMTRQLTGLAAGTADTDAVNVAQLKNVGVAVTGNTGSSDFLDDRIDEG